MALRFVFSFVFLSLVRNIDFNGEAAQRFRIETKSLKFVVIDEMSMIGARTLYVIERRSREINPEKDEPFGGFFTYLFGNFRQLPPVKDTPLYSSKFIELSNSHRENSADSYFTDVLQHLASGDFSDTGLNIPTTRNRAYLSRDEFDRFQTAVELYPTNERVKRSNEDYTQSTGCPLAYISSENTPDIAPPSSKDDSALGLSKYVNLSVNARIVPRVDLRVRGGLLNGSLGTTRYIIYARPPALPLFILEEFVYDNVS
ncbi:uncharacterized protein [Centruroides vittatus]|uniref:uncharacterized protein n=1 Tax=Centruroides vittatus TaxID=120091 RepID=UPI0035103510